MRNIEEGLEMGYDVVFTIFYDSSTNTFYDIDDVYRMEPLPILEILTPNDILLFKKYRWDYNIFTCRSDRNTIIEILMD